VSVESTVFAKLKPDFSRFPAAGFIKTGRDWKTEIIVTGDFRAEITVSSAGKVTGRLYDRETGDEYLAVNIPSQSGAFVASVREAYAAALKNLAAKCFHAELFKSPQSNRICALAEQTFGDKAEFAFDEDDIAVFRLPHLNKWYAVLMEIERCKIEPGARGSVEVLNLKAPPDQVQELQNHSGFYRCYHMNKKLWITLTLDGRISDTRIMELMAQSRRLVLAGAPKSFPAGEVSEGDWLVPADPQRFDLYDYFKRKPTCTWVQTARRILPGDAVYIYAGAPYSSICFRFRVLETNLEEKGSKHPAMRITLEEAYPRDLFPLSKLRQFGVTSVRCARRMPKALKDEILRAAGRKSIPAKKSIGGLKDNETHHYHSTDPDSADISRSDCCSCRMQHKKAHRPLPCPSCVR
jgi:predicted DNA-binding protein (MmcQ/YjbR family)